jgi:hypothetical protein
MSEKPSPDASLHSAVVAYLNFLRKSVNVGPLTKNPTREAALLRVLMDLTRPNSNTPAEPLSSQDRTEK